VALSATRPKVLLWLAAPVMHVRWSKPEAGKRLFAARQNASALLSRRRAAALPFVRNRLLA
jgi:hypothetical protein